MIKQKKLMWAICIVFWGIMLCSCGEESSRGHIDDNIEKEIDSESVLTSSKESTSTPVLDPTATPTPKPTSTPTPEPTATPTPTPLVIPDPIVYEGSGDKIIDLEPMDSAWVLYAKGNSSSRHFSILGYDDNNERTELFVNTSNPYEGITVDAEQTTTALEISATDSWHIEQRSIWGLEQINEGDTLIGTGDDVIIIMSYGRSALIKGNAEGRHFAVKTFGASNNNLMVNTSDPYEGQVMLTGKPFLMVVDAEGEWEITFE